MLSEEQRTFWAAIRETPEDDAPRLVYADWRKIHPEAAAQGIGLDGKPLPLSPAEKAT